LTVKFPFDDQLCEIVFGSWSYTFHYLNYSLMDENPSLENYTENNEWTLMGYKPFRHEIKYANWIENDTFSEIRYKILIQRKPLFVIQNCVIPAIMLCILTLASFFIPFAQEMQIGISIMLAFSVFKLRLSDDVPVQSDSVPLVNIYFTICMSFSLAAMIWFSCVNLLKENKRVPKIIRTLVLNYICHIMCSKYIEQKRNDSGLKKRATSPPSGKTSPDTYTQVVNTNTANQTNTTVLVNLNSEQVNRQLKRIGGVFLSNNGTLNNATNSSTSNQNNYNYSSVVENVSGSVGNLNHMQKHPVGSGSPRQTVVGVTAISGGVMCKHLATTDSITTNNTSQVKMSNNRNNQVSAGKQRRSDFYIANEKNAAVLKKKKYSIESSKIKNASEFGKI
jgi:hypothetical protein